MEPSFYGIAMTWIRKQEAASPHPLTWITGRFVVIPNRSPARARRRAAQMARERDGDGAEGGRPMKLRFARWCVSVAFSMPFPRWLFNWAMDVMARDALRKWGGQ